MDLNECPLTTMMNVQPLYRANSSYLYLLEDHTGSNTYYSLVISRDQQSKLVTSYHGLTQGTIGLTYKIFLHICVVCRLMPSLAAMIFQTCHFIVVLACTPASLPFLHCTHVLSFFTGPFASFATFFPSHREHNFSSLFVRQHLPCAPFLAQ